MKEGVIKKIRDYYRLDEGIRKEGITEE